MRRRIGIVLRSFKIAIFVNEQFLALLLNCKAIFFNRQIRINGPNCIALSFEPIYASFFEIRLTGRARWRKGQIVMTHAWLMKNKKWFRGIFWHYDRKPFNRDLLNGINWLDLTWAPRSGTECVTWLSDRRIDTDINYLEMFDKKWVFSIPWDFKHYQLEFLSLLFMVLCIRNTF